MVDLITIASTFKQALEIIDTVKGFLPQSSRGKPSNPDLELLNTLLPGIWHDFLAIQQEINIGLREKDELIQKLKTLEQWDAESKRYVLKEIGRGVFVYSLKETVDSGGEPPHNICPKCFQDKRKSILQAVATSQYGTRFKCFSCQSEIFTNPGIGFPDDFSPI